jgi:hypothetical protein
LSLSEQKVAGLPGKALALPVKKTNCVPACAAMIAKFHDERDILLIKDRQFGDH